MAISIVMPRLGDFMIEGVVTALKKAAGDSITQGDIIAEIETEKVNYDLEATDSGTFHPVVEAGATVPVDGIIGYILSEGEDPPLRPEVGDSHTSISETMLRSSTGPSKPVSNTVIPSTPGARKLASKLDVDIACVTPSGPRGRVVEEDVRAYSDRKQAGQLPSGLPTPLKSIPVTGIRETIAKHMLGSLSTTAQLSYSLEVDVTEAQRSRRGFSKDSDLTVTLGHVVIKAVAETLKRFPMMNTIFSNGEILFFDDINIGLAVSLDDGLIVPVLRDAGNKNIKLIASEAAKLAEKARNENLLPDEVLGGTFTVSILGVVDVFTPILNRGQTAILGVGRSVEKPAIVKGEILAREMLTLSLTADHQIVDGATAASFLRRLQQMIERPGQLFK